MQFLSPGIVALVVVFISGIVMAQDSLKSKLLGSWRLTGYVAESPTGDAIYPLGKDAKGYIMYTPDGHMSATVMQAGRAKFASADMMAGTPEELANSAMGYLSYAGTFDTDDANNIVIHHIKTALVPNWVGGDFKRKVILDGNKLELRGLAPSLVGGEMRLVRVLWERTR